MEHGRVTAVVWHGDGSPPDALAGALRRQSIQWESARGPYDAASRMLVKRGGRGRVLIVVADDRPERVDDVRRTLERFDPVAGCWQFEGGERPRLSPMPALERPPEPTVVVRPRASAAPGLRLAGEGSAGTAVEPAEPAEAPRSVLTPDELAMLLEDDDRRT